MRSYVPERRCTRSLSRWSGRSGASATRGATSESSPRSRPGAPATRRSAACSSFRAPTSPPCSSGSRPSATCRSERPSHRALVAGVASGGSATRSFASGFVAFSPIAAGSTGMRARMRCGSRCTATSTPTSATSSRMCAVVGLGATRRWRRPETLERSDHGGRATDATRSISPASTGASTRCSGRASGRGDSSMKTCCRRCSQAGTRSRHGRQTPAWRCSRVAASRDGCSDAPRARTCSW